jgi:ABC-2 type transport system permease protein
MKYAAVARIAVSQGRREKGEVYGRMAFFAVVLGVFSSLWRAAEETGLLLVGDRRTLVWYLAGTEWILLSAPLVHLQVQEAVRRGDVACALARPVSYAGAVFAEGIGLLAARAPPLACAAFLSAFAFTGWIPPAPALAAVAIFGSIASALLTAFHVGIGLLAFWIEDVSPVFWVWQKLLFVLGGLMLPIGMYPEFIRQAAALTPFPVVLAGPASFLLEDPALPPHLLASRLAIWCAVTAAVVSGLYVRATARMTVNGG